MKYFVIIGSFFFYSAATWLVFWQPDYAEGTGLLTKLKDLYTLNPDVAEDGRARAASGVAAGVILAAMVWFIYRLSDE